MKRITVADVKRAYAKTGLTPVCGRFGDGEFSGCPLTATIKAAGKDAPRSRATRATEMSDYALGFVQGVDGHGVYRINKKNTQPYSVGYRDGLAVREAIFPKA